MEFVCFVVKLSWRSWLKHYAMSWKVEVSIPDEAFECFPGALSS
jgi:hypothetical protein